MITLSKKKSSFQFNIQVKTILFSPAAPPLVVSIVQFKDHSKNNNHTLAQSTKALSLKKGRSVVLSSLP